jgi:hypothetical protein
MPFNESQLNSPATVAAQQRASILASAATFYLQYAGTGAMASLAGYTVYFTGSGSAVLSPTGTESSYGYIVEVPMSGYANSAAFVTAVTDALNALA